MVVGYWELIPMKSGAEFLALQDIATVRVAKEKLAEKTEEPLVDGG